MTRNSIISSVILFAGLSSNVANGERSNPDSIGSTYNESILDEIVVTALGIGKDRKSLGYSVSELQGDELNINGVSNISAAVQGKLTGVDIRPSSSSPGASTQIVIRGARSFSDSNRPLYVIDGMPVAANPDYSTGNSTRGADLADRSIDFNPDDIESISFLKGQAASALYGIRASNGVVLITTKRAKKKATKPTVTLTTNLSGQILSRRFRPQEIYAQGTAIDAYNPNAATNWGPKIVSLPDVPTYGGNSQGHPGMYYNPKLELAGLDTWTTPTIYDNVGDFFDTGFTENTSLSITQALDQATYSFAINNTYQNGVVPGTDMNRWNVRGLVDWILSENWKTGFSANYVSTTIHSAPTANNAIVNTVYQAPAEYDLKGTPYNIPNEPTNQISYRPTVYDNPYWEVANNNYYQHTGRGFGNAYLEYLLKFGPDSNMELRIREQAGLDAYTTSNSDILEKGAAAAKNGSVTNYGVTKSIFNNLFTASYNALFGEDFDLDAMLGSEIENRTNRWRSYTGTNFNFYGMPTMGNATVFTSREYTSRGRTVGFFGSLSLGWRSMLYINATGRTDIVSSMPRNHRTFFYPSVSLSWIFTELPIMKANGVIDFGKLRISFAEVGQAGSYRENYMIVPTYSGGMYTSTPIIYPINGVTSYIPYQLVYDPNLRPQNTRNVEGGFDLDFFNRRLKIGYTLSYQDVEDQIFSIPTAGSTGYRYMEANAGKIRTWSNEIELQGVILRHPDYDLSVGVGACATVADLMAERNDPRLAIYASDLFSTGVLFAEAGSNLCATIDNVGAPAWLSNSAASLHLLSLASLRFIIAECKSRLGQDPTSDFQEGIRASMKDYVESSSMELDQDGVETYITSFISPDLKEIMIQKYISQTRDEHIETYNDMRRFIAEGENYIVLSNPNNRDGGDSGANRWPYSIPYGNSDVISNPNVAEAFGTGNSAGYYIFTQPLWLFSK